MAIDPTAPMTPIVPAVPAGMGPDAALLARALARQALSDAAAQLGEIIGRPAEATAGDKPVAQAGQAATADAGHAADAPPSKVAVDVPPSQAKPTPETRLAHAVRTAVAEAVPRQAGLATLMANVRALVDSPDVPPEVREASQQLLARTPSAQEIATPRGLRRAIERSGVFLEARVARSAAAVALGGVPRAVDAGDLKAALLVFRGALSAWLARAASPAAGEVASTDPTIATEPSDATAAHDPEAPPAPVPPRSAPPPRLGQALGPASPPAPDPLEGGFEALPGTDAPSEPRQTPAPPSGHPPAPEKGAPPGVDTRPASPRDDPPLEPRFAGFTASPRAPAAPAPPDHATLPAVVQLGLIEAADPASPPPGDPVSANEAKPAAARAYGSAQPEVRAKEPPPPYAGGPIAGQKPATPDLPANRQLVDLVRHLMTGAGGALARQDLMQIASLPDLSRHDGETPEAKPQAARLNLDLPFMTPQGVAVAQMEISRDGGGAGGGAAAAVEQTYRARFSIDLEPLGPVHALVTLTGARARVSLWAERAETIARLRAGEESLGAALREAQLSPEVAVYSGAPPSAAGGGPLGHFVDQAS